MLNGKGSYASITVEAHVSDNADAHVTESNHPVLLTVFHPLLTACLRGALDDVEREHPERHRWCRCARLGHRCACFSKMLGLRVAPR